MQDFDLAKKLAAQRMAQYGGQIDFQAPQGQMVSGHYVAPNVLQYLASGLRSFGGMRGQQIAQDELKGLSEQERNATAMALRQFSQNAQGVPENAPGDGMGPVQPAKQPNMMNAFQSLLDAPDQGLRQTGMQGVISTQQAQAAAQAKAQEQQRIARALQTMSPQQAIAAGIPPELVKNFYESRNFGRDKVKFEDVGGEKIAVTEYGDRPQGVAPLQKTGNPFSDLVVRGQDGQIAPNAPLVGVKKDIGAASRPQVSVDARQFNTQETEQSKVYGKKLGEIRSDITQAGYDAPAKLARLDRLGQLLEGVDGGAAAPALADIASFANSLGIKIDPKLGAKQAAEALSREMAGSLRQPGTGPMTDKDFDNFLRQVPSLSKTAEGRAQIMSTMRAAIERDARAAQFSRQYAEQNRGVIDDKFFDAMAEFYKSNPVVQIPMPDKNARGQSFSDPGKEARYQNWLKSQGAQK